jgi:hypothetical protein
MGPALSPGTGRRVAVLFAQKTRAEVCTLLINKFGNNLSSCQDLGEIKFERIRFATLKLSSGDFGRLKKAVEMAKRDWRDLLMASGFAHDVAAHARWFPDKNSK